MDFQTRVAVEEDFDFIFELNREESFSRDVEWVKKEYIQRIKDGVHGQLFIVESKGQRIGFYGLKEIEDGIRITKIFFTEDYQGKGFGTKILQSLQTFGRTLELGTHENNKVALHFYKKNGFQVVSQKKHFVTLSWKPDDIIE